MKSLVIGMGEVGSALYTILNQASYYVDEYDICQKYEYKLLKEYDLLHICIPFSDKFIEQVNDYKFKYNPKYTIIHSTVPVGTSRKCDAINSPIRGLHPNLEEGIMTFPKFIGGEKASEVADYFRKAGLSIILCDTQESTELGKLLETEYYRVCIEFCHKAKELSNKYQVPFHEVYTLQNRTYNDGYTKLNKPEYHRPILQPIMTPIGGHCVMPNKELLV